MAVRLVGPVQVQSATVHGNGDQEFIIQNVFKGSGARVMARGNIKGPVTITGGVVGNILLSPYVDLNKVPNIKAKVDQKIQEEANKQKFHVKFI